MLKPQDILILLKLSVWHKGEPCRIIDIATEVGMSPSEVHASLIRSTDAHLFDPISRRPILSSLCELLVHGIRYIIPAKPGAEGRGMATAHSAPPLVNLISADERDKYVWSLDSGKTRGFLIEPIYKSVPTAAARDSNLYELMVLVDALRVGRAREREIARAELEKRLKANVNEE
jgi:hypothetical protein